MDEEFVVCAVCDRKFQRITSTHVKTHGLSLVEYIAKFPAAELVTARLRKISAEVGKKNKGKPTWSKGVKFSPEYRQRISDSHWSRKPKEETRELRAKLAENGRRALKLINSDGRAFRMQSGHHTEDHKAHMRELMKNRKVTWQDKIRESHWTRKSPEEVQEIVDCIQQNGTPRNAKSGWYFSPKMSEKFFFMSSYEERRMQFLDSCDDVLEFTNKHKIWIDYFWQGQVHRYNPDLLVTMRDGTKRLEEIKGAILDIERTQAKETACIQYATQHNLQYMMLFEQHLEVL